MLGRKIVLGLGLAVLIPALVYRGIELVRPRPTVQRMLLLNSRHPVETREQALQLLAKQKADQKKWAKTHFWIAVPVGVIVTLLGSFSAVQGFGGGLMLGGIFTFLHGYALYLSELGRLGNFLVLLGAFSVLLWIGFKGLAQMRRPEQSAA